ncbi:MAG TPA: PIG-L deacetylase family protein [Candidatus Paceibacterota bacterium]|nr:PIG-L deacetylase family protein [Candidatus Paceibacterota bacterium]
MKGKEMTPQTILAVGAHPDDIELGCGGTIAKLIKAGAQVRALVLTKGEVGNRNEQQYDRVKETREALMLLGVKDMFIEDHPDTFLHEHLNALIACIESHVQDLKPDRVYTMFEHDRHQDHRSVFNASTVACRSVRQVLCYETPSCYSNFAPQDFEDIGEHVEIKVAALKLHVSQRDRPYTQPDAMRSIAVSRGLQAGIGYAEAFIGYRFIL